MNDGRPAVIRHRGLTKRFGRVRAVDGIDLDVRAGDIYGFLGANGSGKTTTVRMLLGLVLATSGEIDLLGERMPRAGRQVLPRVGALIEGPADYGHLSGRENLSLLDAAGRAAGGGPGGSGSDEALEQVGLAGVGRRPVKAYSLGMRQRLGLAGALLRRPELLVLDEPTNGLDPQGIAEVRELLLELHRTGTTVFLSSHLLAEVEQMCTRVGVLDRGRLVLQDELAMLTAPTGRSCTRRRPTGSGRRSTAGSRARRRRGSSSAARPGRGQRPARRAGVPVTGLALERPTLEEVVLAAAGEHRPGGAIEARDPRRAAQAVPRPRTWATIASSTRCRSSSRCCCGHRPGATAGDEGRRSSPRSSPTARCSRWRRWRSCCRCSCRSRSPSSPGTRSPGRPRPDLRYLLARPAGRTRLLVAKLSRCSRSSLVTVVVVAGVGYLLGSTLFEAQPIARHVGVGHHVSRRRVGRPDRAGHRLRDGVDAAGWPRSRCSSRRSPTRRSARRWARWPCWSRRRCCSPSTPRHRSRRTCRPATGCRSSTSSATRSCGGTSSAARAAGRLRRGAAGAAWANFTTKDVTS